MLFVSRNRHRALIGTFGRDPSGAFASTAYGYLAVGN